MAMNENVFQACLEAWTNSVGNQGYWSELASQFGYISGESLRSAFKRERKARGIEKVNHRIVQHDVDMPVVGIIDIEVLPAEGYFFQADAGYITADKLTHDTTFLSWAGKYANNDTIFSDILTPDEAHHRNPFRITESALAFMNSCDYLIGHNIKRYDYPHLNTFAIEQGFPPIKEHRLIDTLTIAKKNFKFLYNSLAYINKKLGIRHKLSNDGFSLWKRCANSDASALRTMLEYNEGDILATEELFWRLQPYARRHLPNLSVYNDDLVNVCWCGSTKYSRAGYWHTDTARFERNCCKSCGSYVRGKKNLLSKEKRESLMVMA